MRKSKKGKKKVTNMVTNIVPTLCGFKLKNYNQMFTWPKMEQVK